MRDEDEKKERKRRRKSKREKCKSVTFFFADTFFINIIFCEVFYLQEVFLC